jgi:hypothetical protein
MNSFYGICSIHSRVKQQKPNAVRGTQLQGVPTVDDQRYINAIIAWYEERTTQHFFFYIDAEVTTCQAQFNVPTFSHHLRALAAAARAPGQT